MEEEEEHMESSQSPNLITKYLFEKVTDFCPFQKVGRFNSTILQSPKFDEKVEQEMVKK
jgi:hypothetical protein